MERIDAAIEWISQREASYLCKEDKVTWFASITGNPEDADWQSMSLAQLKRVITCTIMGVHEEEIISAFQELGEIYEMGVNSTYQVPSMIFNYNSKSPISKAELVIKEILVIFKKYKMFGVVVEEVNEIIDKVNDYFSIELTSQSKNIYLRKHLALLDYSLRSDRNRVYFDGRKVTAILYKDTNPNQIKYYQSKERNTIVNMVITKLK